MDGLLKAALVRNKLLFLYIPDLKPVLHRGLVAHQKDRQKRLVAAQKELDRLESFTEEDGAESVLSELESEEDGDGGVDLPGLECRRSMSATPAPSSPGSFDKDKGEDMVDHKDMTVGVQAAPLSLEQTTSPAEKDTGNVSVVSSTQSAHKILPEEPSLEQAASPGEKHKGNAAVGESLLGKAVLPAENGAGNASVTLSAPSIYTMPPNSSDVPGCESLLEKAALPAEKSVGNPSVTSSALFTSTEDPSLEQAVSPGEKDKGNVTVVSGVPPTHTTPPIDLGLPGGKSLLEKVALPAEQGVGNAGVASSAPSTRTIPPIGSNIPEGEQVTPSGPGAPRGEQISLPAETHVLKADVGLTKLSTNTVPLFPAAAPDVDMADGTQGPLLEDNVVSGVVTKSGELEVEMSDGTRVSTEGNNLILSRAMAGNPEVEMGGGTKAGTEGDDLIQADGAQEPLVEDGAISQAVAGQKASSELEVEMSDGIQAGTEGDDLILPRAVADQKEASDPEVEMSGGAPADTERDGLIQDVPDASLKPIPEGMALSVGKSVGKPADVDVTGQDSTLFKMEPEGESGDMSPGKNNQGMADLFDINLADLCECLFSCSSFNRKSREGIRWIEA